jgi:hypothetical protein
MSFSIIYFIIYTFLFIFRVRLSRNFCVLFIAALAMVKDNADHAKECGAALQN